MYSQAPPPSLIEEGTAFFLNGMLHHSHSIRTDWNNMLFNIMAFIAFVIILATFLTYRYKGWDRAAHAKAKQTKILDELHKLQTRNPVAGTDLMTDLPLWESEFGLIHAR